MSVMNLPNFQPKRKNLYAFTIAGSGINAWQIKQCARPTAMLNKVTVNYLNIKRHYGTGKLQWSDIPITLIDPINPSASQQVMSWLRMHHQSDSGRAGYASMYKKSITIEVLGPGLQVVQSWALKGCFINGNVDFGNQAYDSDQLHNVSFSISIDEAILNY